MKKVFIFLIIIFLVSCKHYENQDSSRISLEKQTPAIDSLMRLHRLTGLSVAVIDGYDIVWHNEYGYKENGSKEQIDENTAYSTASISKAITATTCLILEEQGKIDIDVPIRRYLKRWQLPKSDYLLETDVTIRHLLSHTSGATHEGYADFYGNDTIPTIVEVLNGELLPRTNDAIDFLFEPGSDVLYSGGGFVIVQLALEDELNKTFQEIVAETVFAPLQMNHTTMVQPNQKGFLTNIAKVHNIDQEVIRTGVPICPQLGPSGTWSTAKDLALFALETQKALNDKDTKVFSSNAAKKISEIMTYKYKGGGTLGWERAYAFGNIEWLTIMGQNSGVGGEINVSLQGGKGIVMLANGESKNRLPVFNFLRSQVIKKMNWDRKIYTDSKPLDENFQKNVQGSYLDFMYGDFSEMVKILESDGELFISSPIIEVLTGNKMNKMFYQGNFTFKVDGYPNLIEFDYVQNAIQAVSIYRNSSKLSKLKFPIEELKTVGLKVLDAFSNPDFDTCKLQYETIKKQEKNYDFSNSLLEVGVAFYNRNEIEKTLQIFKFNAQENPNVPISYIALAEIYERIGNIPETIRSYKKVLTLAVDEDQKEEIIMKIKSLK